MRRSSPLRWLPPLLLVGLALAPAGVTGQPSGGSVVLSTAGQTDVTYMVPADRASVSVPRHCGGIHPDACASASVSLGFEGRSSSGALRVISFRLNAPTGAPRRLPIGRDPDSRGRAYGDDALVECGGAEARAELADGTSLRATSGSVRVVRRSPTSIEGTFQVVLRRASGGAALTARGRFSVQHAPPPPPQPCPADPIP